MLQWATAVAMVAAALANAPAQRQEVLVSSAASLADVMATLARSYEVQTGVRVVVNTGASNTLARQIRAGAAVDLFISADDAQMFWELTKTLAHQLLQSARSTAPGA